MLQPYRNETPRDVSIRIRVRSSAGKCSSLEPLSASISALSSENESPRMVLEDSSVIEEEASESSSTCDAFL